jgi:diacylglycerol kinase family enzyme
MKLLFVVNPISGGVDKSQIIEEITSLCTLHSIVHKIFIWEKELDVMGFIVGFTPSRIIVVGGDGTLNFAVDKLAHLNLPFGLVSLGSANGTAKEINLSTNSLEALTDAVFSNNFLYSDVVFINEHLSVHLADIGLNAEIVNKFDQEPERGFMSYAKHLFSTIIETKEKDFRIEANGEVYFWRGYMLTFANASRYGSGIIINPDGDITDGYFELCNVKDLSIEALLMLGFSKYSEGVILSNYIDQIKTKQAVVETTKPYLLQADGELIGEFTRFEIRIEPRYFRFVVR